MSKGTGRLLGVSVAVVLVGALALPASAQTRAKVTSGTCSGASTWILTLKWDAGRVESDVEVQTPAAGQVWKSAFKDNGTVFGYSTKATLADGSWSATRFAANQAGPDVITVRGTNTVTGEVCRASGIF